MTASREAMAVAASTAMMVALVACSDGAPGSGQFVASIDGICNTLGKGLADLDAPTSLDDVGGFAADASQLFLTGVTQLKKLPVPANAPHVADANDLVSKLDHLVDVLDDVATAAKKGDTATVGSRTDEFESVRGDISDLADSLDASHCGLDPQFDQMAPPVTEPPATQPPTTRGGTTAGSNKNTISLTKTLKPAAGFSFADVADSLLTTWTSVVDSSPTARAITGGVTGVEVSSNGKLLGRVFIFIPDSTVPFTALDDFGPTLTSGAKYTGEAINGFPGVVWTNSEGVYGFLGAQSKDSPKFFVYAVAPNHDALVAIITGLWASIPA
ncbi:MAG: hypothetical protein WCK21_02035 [Actinomycetota bacterium]